MRFRNLLEAARKCDIVPARVVANLEHFSELFAEAQ